MNIIALLADLAKADIRLWLDDGQLRFNAPEGAMTDARKALIREHKDAVVHFLMQSQAQQQQVISQADRNQPLALSFQQQRLWFLNRLEPDNSAYHIHAALDVRGDLQVDRLQAACNKIIARHEVLRTNYKMQAGKLEQVVQAQLDVCVQYQLAGEAEVEKLLQEEVNKPFDLSCEPVLRALVLEASPQHYVLSFTIHHIASDGWSMGVLVSELLQYYQDVDATLLAPAVQYADYAQWQQQQQKVLEADLSYWQTQLNQTPVLNLPLDYQRHKDQSDAGGFYGFYLPTESFSQLQNTVKANSTTLFVVLMALYSGFLARLTGDKDFAIGTPIAGRTNSQLEQVMGCFVNILALRFEQNLANNLHQAVTETKALVAEAFNHQEVPFEQVVDALNIERDLTLNPVFQTLLVLQNTPLVFNEVDGLNIQGREALEQAAQFDLSLNVQEQNEGLHIQVSYKKALFKAESIKTLAQQLERFIAQAVNNSEKPLADIQLYGTEELQALQQQVKAFNQLSAQIPARSFQQNFEKQAQDNPDALAVVHGDSSVSYQALNQKANQLAAVFKKLGVSANDIIALHLDADIDYLIALLACIKSGACYLPIDAQYPEKRCQQIIDDAKPKIILSNTLQLEASKNLKGLLASAELNEQSTVNIADDRMADDLFYCIYTSGSTGTPKGVQIKTSSAEHLFSWYQLHYGIDAGHRFAIASSVAFDLTQKNFFAPLIAGAAVVLPELGPFNPAEQAKLITEQSISHINAAPSVIKAVLAASSAPFKGLQAIFMGGEPIDEALLSELDAKTSTNCRWVNMYGPTECADISCVYEIGHADKQVFIGSAIAGVQSVVVDTNSSNEELCSIGKTGELWVSGVGVAKGYINQALTEQYFVESELLGEKQRFYRTGDLVRQNEQGLLSFVGRKDEQVKLRGLRIELAEIEHCLEQHAAIKKSVVKVSQDKLVAYYQSSSEIANEDLRQQVVDNLPSYMLPSIFIAIEDWPLNLSGKVNKRALPEPDFAKQLQAQYAAPETEVEKVLVDIWQQVLEVERVGIDDSFFDLGGHSLTATQVFSLTQEHFNVDVPLREIFDQPTIRYIAKSIEQALLEDAVFAEPDQLDDEEQESFTL